MSRFTRGPALVRAPPAVTSLSFVPALLASAQGRSLRRATPWRRWLLVAGVVLGLHAGGHGADAASPAPPPPAGLQSADGLPGIVAEAARRFGIPRAWIEAVMRLESGGQARAVSPKGAMGLMQLMPRTWADLRIRYGLGVDPFDPRDNITAGAAYLRELWDRFGPAGFLAAYDAGPARYQDHLATGRPLPAETQTYVARLAPAIGGETFEGVSPATGVVRSWTEAPLFASHARDYLASPAPALDGPSIQPTVHTISRDQAAPATPSDGLFVPPSSGSTRQ
ncbi:MAG: lytic transglycosylase domain-containing protein [Caulobacteraceae bacterium]